MKIIDKLFIFQAENLEDFPRRKWKDSVKTDLKKLAYVVGWIHLTQCRSLGDSNELSDSTKEDGCFLLAE